MNRINFHLTTANLLCLMHLQRFCIIGILKDVLKPGFVIHFLHPIDEQIAVNPRDFDIAIRNGNLDELLGRKLAEDFRAKEFVSPATILNSGLTSNGVCVDTGVSFSCGIGRADFVRHIKHFECAVEALFVILIQKVTD